MTASLAPFEDASRKRKQAIASAPASLNGASRSKRPRTIAHTPSSKHLLTVQHPQGIKPLGNFLFDSSRGIRECRSAGLGYAAALSDELVLDLLSRLQPAELCRLAQCSKALYCFAYHEDLWRALTVRLYGQGGWGTFAYNWRETLKKKICAERKRTFVRDQPIQVDGFYSDLLFTSFRCASAPLRELCGVETDNIDRRSDLTYETFMKEYGTPNRPVIITDVVTKWPAYGKWSTEYLLEHCGDKIFRAESVDIPFRDYVTYAEQCNEEAPLYLFDKKFAENTTLAEDYHVPLYFKEDFFSVLGDQRPDYQWLIIGPARSGSTFHVDPNSTSAWNAVITGAKKWVMYPPEVVPPGVFPSPDGSEVTTPLSLSEWFLNFYMETKNSPVKPVECVCRAGEMVFVPCGWWHCVMNLEPSIALTQNFVATSNLPSVLRFLKYRRDQVSGSCYGTELYERFTEALNHINPGLIYDIEAKDDIQENAKIVNRLEKRESFWDRIMKSDEGINIGAEGRGFSFAFGGDD
ncbi:uncharacterized protein SPPG_03865 [Spizellomyces punctatus DAOM BR117]|uniref:JmjC domain-containing protein n=1 Tax=Spizellomyces punctatus (strain DAOM BR117) TaxID=645134 RepID=A0A0L0HH08_SPIPD|nr:uncharacterized protein SPPG_03865 [Spizellomyces punctatus DAOM BR117]KND00751.1 hypothetical protein SPPG_03865 [Spizellomyces punctatus DAOM BR117]|eukprot:XP_016608790.1 hypothetical protein SPPG_03865 [Spizellomyces punctatus DAOM BR117]